MLRTISSIGNFITSTLQGISAVGGELTNRVDTWMQVSAEKQKTISIMEMNQEILEAAEKHNKFLHKFTAQERTELDALIEAARNYKFHN